MAEGSTDYSALEKSIGFSFTNRSTLIRALTHPSWLQQQEMETEEHNQRLEFLGDAVIGLGFAELLFRNFPEEREGNLTRARAILVRGSHLALIAREIHLNDYLRLSDSEEANQGRERDSILEDAFEALIGAVYLDSGLESAIVVLEHIFGDLHQRLQGLSEEDNPKGQLQERIQPHYGNQAIEYAIIAEEGPAHEKSFEVEVRILGDAWGRGTGNSKKEAESNAAKEAILVWQDRHKGS